MKARSIFGSKKILLILTLLIGALSASAITFGDSILAPLGFVSEASSLAKLESEVQVVGDPARLSPGTLPGLTSPSMFAFQTTVDDSGADDEPGQKDLNLMAIDFGDLGDDIFLVKWQWDNTATTGNNTRDGGALFDTDGDGNANYSLYITVNTNGTYVTQLYVCTADSRADRCGGPALDNSFASAATVTIVANSDPFGPTGSNPTASHSVGNTCIGRPGCYTADTVANVVADLNDFGDPANIKLLNVCSYPSGEPNSDPSDCVVEQPPGFLTLVKVVNNFGQVGPNYLGAGAFPLTINGNSATSGTPVSVVAGNYTIAETSDSRYTVGKWDCDIKPDGQVGSVSTTVTIASGENVVCTMTNTLTPILAIDLQKVGTVNMAVVAPNDRVDAGDVINYAFTVTNNSNVTLTNVTLADTVGGVTISGGPIASLAPGASNNSTFTGSKTLTQANINAGSFTNTAQTCGTPPSGAGSAVCDTDDDTQNFTPVKTIDLQKVGTVDKTVVAPNDQVNAGDKINYAFTVTNTGNVTLTNVTITDPKITVVGGPIASLAPGASNNTTFTGSYTLTQADVNAGTFTNTAEACGTPPSGSAVCDTDDDTRNFTPNLAIELLKTGTLDITAAAPSNRVDAGDKVNYAFTVTNNSNVTLTNVTLADTIGGVSISGGPIASLAPGAVDSTTFTGSYTLTQADINAGTFTNTATACGTPPTGSAVCDPDDDTQTLPRLPGLSIVKTADRTTYNAVGQVISYTITATNTGNTTLTNVTVTDPKVSDLSCTPTSGSNSVIPGGTVVCTASHTVTQADIDGGQYANTSCVNAATATQACDDETVTSVPDPKLSITKTASPTTYNAVGQVITYTIVAKNEGNVTLNNVAVEDALVSNLDCNPNVAGNQTTGFTLAPQATLTCSATHTITQADLDNGTFQNTACVDDGTGGAVQKCDDETVTAVPEPKLLLVKTARIKVITYSFVITNTGNVTLSLIELTDPLFISDNNPTGQVNGCTKESLAPGAQAVCEADYTVTEEDYENGYVTNIATATAAGGVITTATVTMTPLIVVSPTPTPSPTP